MHYGLNVAIPLEYKLNYQSNHINLVMHSSLQATDSQQDLPGDFALWVFIFAEMLVFGVLFVAYAFTRMQNVELFNASQLTLSRTYGAINTLALITSSYFVVRAVAAIKLGRTALCVYW